MAVGLKQAADLLPVPGVELAAISAGIYPGERLDMAILSLAEGSISAAVFTQNAFCAAPVQLAREHLDRANPKFLVINAGNANAGTGKRGYEDAERICADIAKLADCATSYVLPFSTGVIGEYLPLDNIRKVLPALYSQLAEDQWLACAQAIMTTDTLAKGVSRTLVIQGKTLTLTGIAKGSGMIRPDMATMLAFIATDAPVEQNVLRGMLEQAVEQSFNRICVDGDTSTNDALVLTATAKANMEIISEYESEAADLLQAALNELCAELAQAIVRDGEGASKFVTITVKGGRDTQECLDVAYTVANSPLVKTALFASDPNWGRILAAVGRAGIDDLQVCDVVIHINDLCIVENGERAASYREEEGQAAMEQDEILLTVNLGRGEQTESVWTCDLSHDYVTINAEYRT